LAALKFSWFEITMKWQKGQSGNPGGRHKSLASVKQLARRHAPEAVQTLIKIMRNSKQPALQVVAANSILDRAYGRPSTDPERGEHLTITIKQIVNGRLEVVGDPSVKPLVIDHDATETHE